MKQKIAAQLSTNVEIQKFEVRKNKAFDWSVAAPYFDCPGHEGAAYLDSLSRTFKELIEHDNLSGRLKVSSALKNYRTRQFVSDCQKEVRGLSVQAHPSHSPSLAKFAEQLTCCHQLKELDEYLNKFNRPISEITKNILFQYKKQKKLVQSLRNTMGVIRVTAEQAADPPIQLGQMALLQISKLKLMQLSKHFCQGMTKTLSRAEVMHMFRCTDKQSVKRKISKLKRTKARFSLKTNCQICFCGREASYDPINKCGKCEIRYHQSCFGTGTHICQNCRSASESVAESKCGFCFRSDMVLKTVKFQDQEFSYHPFCLVLSGQALYEQGELLPMPGCEGLNSFGRCQCGSPGSLVYCQVCGQRWHPICAYFKGARFRVIEAEGVRMEVGLKCCGVKGSTYQGLCRGMLVNAGGRALEDFEQL